MCETPKSPPGDYNYKPGFATRPTPIFAGVKHLNPRQGITTFILLCLLLLCLLTTCETPKSPPGDYNRLSRGRSRDRQRGRGVKHLNPRQGITTMNLTNIGPHPDDPECETPKSPPGDYNLPERRTGAAAGVAHTCETPKSPPGDYNRSILRRKYTNTLLWGV